MFKMEKRLTPNNDFSTTFSLEELNLAINELKWGKAPGLDKMFAEFIKHFGLNVKHWLLTIVNEILNTGTLPKFFKKSKVIAALKPGKKGTGASCFRPIFLLKKVVVK